MKKRPLLSGPHSEDMQFVQICRRKRIETLKKDFLYFYHSYPTTESRRFIIHFLSFRSIFVAN